MHSRGAGSDDHPVDGEFADISSNQVLSRVRTKITIVPGYLYSGKGAGKRGEFLTIDCGSDIRATVTDINTYLFFHLIFSPPP
jgi:hypothetical protein